MPEYQRNQITSRGGGGNTNNQQANQPILSQLKDVYSIYGLKPIYNTFYIYVHSCLCCSVNGYI